MRDLILKLHMHGGLLCPSYLIIFGLSALNYNHHFGKPGHHATCSTPRDSANRPDRVSLFSQH